MGRNAGTLALTALILWGVVLADDPEWRTSVGADGRFVVRGTVPEWVQGVTVWASRGLRVLERETGSRLTPHDEDTLRIVLHPGATETRLQTRRHRRTLHQEIITPGRDQLDSQGLSDPFTRALLQRLAPRGEDPPGVPDWLVFGLSHHLIEGQSEHLWLHGLGLWRENRLPPASSLTRVPATPDTLDTRAHSAGMARMLLRPGGTDRGVSLGRLLEGPLDQADLAGLRPGVYSHRDLNIDRDLWMSGRERSAVAEFRNTELAERRLAQILPLRPGEFGLEGPEVPRHQRFSLKELEDHVDEAWLEPLLVQWMIRLQPLGFRQSEAFVTEIQAQIEAGGHLARAAKSKGRARERHLAAFQEGLERLER